MYQTKTLVVLIHVLSAAYRANGRNRKQVHHFQVLREDPAFTVEVFGRERQFSTDVCVSFKDHRGSTRLREQSIVSETIKINDTYITQIDNDCLLLFPCKAG